MNTNRESLLKEVMAADFTLIDLNLYLNTHPYDQTTIMLFNNCAQRARMLRNEYERLYGPLTASNSTCKCPWQWISSPWPLEHQS